MLVTNEEDHLYILTYSEIHAYEAHKRRGPFKLISLLSAGEGGGVGGRVGQKETFEKWAGQ